ncbi:MAG: HAMP domain-containing histidine kinase [Actinomycetota bacterium]|nr:HAMP domain-containing histidine kinase [Actinomycetota bacterium]
MRRWGPVAIVTIAACAGALTTLVVARGAGMRGGELVHLVELLLPAIAATVVAAALAAPLLRRATVRTRFVALALIGVIVAVANLGVLSALMLVKHDAALIASLIAYSGAAGVGAAVALSRSFRAGVERVAEGAEALGRGDLSTRIGPVDGGPELSQLGRTLDEMAARLEETIAAEQRAVAIRNDLITAVSHDLRTPLAGLRAMVEAIDDGVVDDRDTFRRYAGEMRRSLDALVALVDDLFELVQLDAGAIRAESERATLDEVVGSVLAACGAQAVEKGVSVETALGGAEATFVSPRLTRVLQNLVQNAIRHTPSDGTVRIVGRRVRDSVELAVEDEGEGIPKESLVRVFEPFWRGDASRAERGAGLGLALAKRVVEALGGRLDVDSTVGRGSRFAVVVPAASRE